MKISRMKVNFETDYNDFAEAVWLASGFKSTYKNNLFNFILIYGMVAALGSLPLLLFAPSFVFALVDFVVIFLTCFYFFRPPGIKYYANEYKYIYGSAPFNYEVALDEDGLKISDNLSKSIISWQRVQEISETEDNIFLVFKFKNALKIPKAAFSDTSQIGEFIAFASARTSTPESSIK